MKKFLLLILAISIVGIFSCKNFKRQKRAVQRDLTINQNTSFNNLFFDSIQIESFLKDHSEFKSYEEQFIDFYKERNYQFAWFDNKGIAEQSFNFLNLLNSTVSDLQDSSLYNPTLIELYEKAVADSLHKQQHAIILNTELLFTGQFFAYAAKVYKGSDIDAADLGWFIPRKKLNLKELLDSSIKSKANGIEIYAKQNPQYKKLQEQLVLYNEFAKNETSDTIAYVKKPIKRGDSSEAIVMIKKRLFLLGDAKIPDSSFLYDSLTLIAVKKFQRRMGLSVDGAIGNKMIEELNMPLQWRIKQLLVNMERLRWLPPTKDSNYIVVNIPEYRLHVYDSGKTVMDMNVIVGKAANSTVIFSGNLKYVVFSPYWNVPTSIVKKEIVPAISKNSNYLEKNHMEITGKSNGLPLVRQKPGSYNSLGLVKFLFPNNYDIYLHDTPNRDLFTQSSRSLSHGCIRISEPKKMAQYLLREDTAWNSNTIDSSMHLSKERWVTLKKTVPVLIVYFTAWVDKTGTLNFRKDIYGHDEKMAAKLFIK
ncbi:MAG: L,D-transpeptidase family protein [Bacteroidota bacterium]